MVIPEAVGIVKERQVAQNNGVQSFRGRCKANRGGQHAIDAGGAAVAQVQCPLNRAARQRVTNRRTVAQVDHRPRRDCLADQGKDLQIAKFGLSSKLVSLCGYLLLFFLPALQVGFIFYNGPAQKLFKKSARILVDHVRQGLIRIRMFIRACQVPVIVRLVFPEKLLQ